MEIIQNNLINYIQKGISYDDYLQDIENIITTNSCEPATCEFYILNLQRMKRLNKTILLSDHQKDKLKDLDKKINLIIITEGWCADAAQIIPVVNKLAEASDNLEVKIVYRDKNEELMDAYLTNGARSIPMIVGVGEDGQEEFVWGPRPKFGNDLLLKYKAGDFTTDEFKLNLQKAYNKDKGNTIIEELLSKIINK